MLAFRLVDLVSTPVLRVYSEPITAEQLSYTGFPVYGEPYQVRSLLYPESGAEVNNRAWAWMTEAKSPDVCMLTSAFCQVGSEQPCRSSNFASSVLRRFPPGLFRRFGPSLEPG